ncbi:hypothetical protein FrEUN1fDRAFT_7209 [Parafrankia sp. EUN1f]|nr:hypothetical protein FrEUN1fDRAFT_7209 [Parafrankia sp. EUN1f]
MRHLSTLRSALAWWHETGWLTSDPTAGWVRPKVVVDTTRALTRDQVAALFRLDAPLREKTLWRLLYETAARAEQTHALIEQVMDLLPAFPGGLGAGALGGRWAGFPPAGAVRGDLLADGLGEAMPQVPPVSDLLGGGQDAANAFGVGAGAVPADDLHAGMSAQPGLQDVGAPAGQDVDAAAGVRVDEDRGVAVAAAQREVVHAQDLRDLGRGQRKAQEAAQRGVP